MLIKAGFNIEVGANATTPISALLSLHPSRIGDLRSAQPLWTRPELLIDTQLDSFGNAQSRLTLPPGGTLLSSEFVIEDSGEPSSPAPDVMLAPVNELPAEVLPFLLSSRFCETERLMQSAWGLFGGITHARAMVEAIVDWTHSHITFGYPFARNTRTAWEGYQERVGVCRDFAHLAVTLCRCMNVPARYCTGYLGDIGVPASDAPMDFSAWFDVFVDGDWYTYDARHKYPRIGRILMARGRDATDAAILTSFGTTWLNRFEVTTYELVAQVQN